MIISLLHAGPNNIRAGFGPREIIRGHCFSGAWVGRAGRARVWKLFGLTVIRAQAMGARCDATVRQRGV
jgi:hypothetical protein